MKTATLDKAPPPATAHKPGWGQVLAGTRRQAGRTSASVAAEAGISRRTLVKIEQSDTHVALHHYLAVADVLGVAWLFEAAAPPEGALSVPTRYLSGSTALSLPWGGTPALWYSSALAKPQSWRVAGYNMPDTTRLLGLLGLRDAAPLLRLYGVDTPQLWAASHERAVFDLLCQHCHFQASAPPNVQASDIDDVVDMDQVRAWLDALKAFLGEESLARMLNWLNGDHHEQRSA